MKDQRGITLMSLMIYIIVTILVIATLTTIMSYFSKNLTEIIGQDDSIIEIDKINISIHSLDENDYERITTVKGSYKTATDNIKKLKSNYPLLRVEINTTLTKSLVDNPGELEDLIKFAKSIKADLKIIELFPNTDKENFVPIETLVPLLASENCVEFFSKYTNSSLILDKVITSVIAL